MASKGPKDDFGFFLIIIGIVALAWVGAGAPSGGGNYGNNNQNSSENNTPQTQEEKRQVENKKSIGTLSPLSEYISLRAGSLGGNDPKNEYLEIEVSNNAPSRINITGFTIKSAVSGRGTDIRKATILPFTGVLNVEETIYLSPGDRAYLITGRSPNGYSFKENKCVGYLGQYNHYPSLPSCPSPRDEILPFIGATYRNTCFDYIDSISSCTVPTLDFETSLSLGYDCAQYVTTKINYSECLKKHRNDRDFYGKQWWIYLNYDEPLWDTRREIVLLQDLNKQTVAYFEY